MSTFLQDVLHRINGALGKTPEDYYQAVAGSFLVSCDNAHAVHPNRRGEDGCSQLLLDEQRYRHQGEREPEIHHGRIQPCGIYECLQ